jgi:beta-barrel assembly-enhancing protease
LIIPVGSNTQIEFKTTDPAFPSETFLIQDNALAEQITLAWRQSRSKILNIPHLFNDIHIWRKLIYTLLILFLGIYGLRIGSEHLYKITPLSYDTYLGNKTKTKLLNVLQECETPELKLFLQKIKRELSLKDDRFKYEIQIINHPMENAFALPGGKLFVFKGLLENSNSPEEIIGVLAHEIEHVENRHSIKQLQKSLGIILISTLVIGTAFEGVEIFENAEIVSEIISGLLLMKYSRGYEAEADLKAIRRLSANGFSTQGILGFFQRLDSASHEASQEKQSRVDSYFNKAKKILNTHPSHKNRIQYFEQALQSQTFENNIHFESETQNWETIKSACPEAPEVDYWKIF